MTETLYRKSWQPLAEADKSEDQLVRWADHGEESMVYMVRWIDAKWVHSWNHKPFSDLEDLEFLCLEPVEVETDEFPKVI